MRDDDDLMLDLIQELEPRELGKSQRPELPRPSNVLDLPSWRLKRLPPYAKRKPTNDNDDDDDNRAA